MTPNTAVLAPIPIARVITATAVKPGIRARLRTTCFNRMRIHTARSRGEFHFRGGYHLLHLRSGLVWPSWLAKGKANQGIE